MNAKTAPLLECPIAYVRWVHYNVVLLVLGRDPVLDCHRSIRNTPEV